MLKTKKVLLRIRNYFLKFDFKTSGFGTNLDEDMKIFSQLFMPRTSYAKLIITSDIRRWEKALLYFEQFYNLRRHFEIQRMALTEREKEEFLQKEMDHPFGYDFFVIDKSYKNKIYNTVKFNKEVEFYFEDGGDIFMRSVL